MRTNNVYGVLHLLAFMCAVISIVLLFYYVVVQLFDSSTFYLLGIVLLILLLTYADIDNSIYIVERILYSSYRR